MSNCTKVHIAAHARRRVLYIFGTKMAISEKCQLETIEKISFLKSPSVLY